MRILDRGLYYGYYGPGSIINKSIIIPILKIVEIFISDFLRFAFIV